MLSIALNFNNSLGHSLFYKLFVGALWHGTWYLHIQFKIVGDILAYWILPSPLPLPLLNFSQIQYWKILFNKLVLKIQCLNIN